MMTSNAAALAQVASQRDKDRAIRVVRQFIRKHHLFDWSQNQRCLVFYLSREHPRYFDVAVRVNNARCGGDPNMQPMVTMFQVSRRTWHVLCFPYDLTEPGPCEQMDWFLEDARTAGSEFHGATELPVAAEPAQRAWLVSLDAVARAR
jgi:hypothetical protein